jgi:hypothetical protein
MTDVEKEILALLEETRAGFSVLRTGLQDCLAIAKETNAMLAERTETPK